MFKLGLSNYVLFRQHINMEGATNEKATIMGSCEGSAI